MKECAKNEQKALAECRTLQEAVKDKKELESALYNKENLVKTLESEVIFFPDFTNCIWTLVDLIIYVLICVA